MKKIKWEQGVYKPSDFEPKRLVRLSTRKTNRGKKYYTKKIDKLFKELVLGIALFCVVVGIVGVVSTYHTKKYNEIMTQYQEFKEGQAKKSTSHISSAQDLYELIKNTPFTFVQTVKAEGLPIEQRISQGSVEQTIRRIAKEQSFQWPDYLVKLAKCESGLNPKAVNVTGNKPKQSRDRGLFQINDFYHKNISDAQAFDVEFSTKYTIKLINEGKQGYWVCDKKIK